MTGEHSRIHGYTFVDGMSKDEPSTNSTRIHQSRDGEHSRIRGFTFVDGVSKDEPSTNNTRIHQSRDDMHLIIRGYTFVNGMSKDEPSTNRSHEYTNRDLSRNREFVDYNLHILGLGFRRSNCAGPGRLGQPIDCDAYQNRQKTNLPICKELSTVDRRSGDPGGQF